MKIYDKFFHTKKISKSHVVMMSAPEYFYTKIIIFEIKVKAKNAVFGE